MRSSLKAMLVCLAWVCVGSAWAEEPKAQPVTPPAVRQIQAQAEAARKQNRVDAAIALYKKGVTLEPTWEEGWWSLGTLNYGLDRFDEAREAFKHLAVIQPNIGAPWAMLGLSEF